MLKPLPLTSPDNPRIKAAALLAKHSARRDTGLFLAEGARAIDRAAEAGLKVEDLFVTATLLGLSEHDTPSGLAQLLPNAAAQPTRVWLVPERVMRKLAYCENPEGLLAVVRAAAVSSASILGGLHDATLVLVAVGMTKPGNLGAMARTASAVGVDAMLIADSVVDIYNPNAIRASTGAVFDLPIAMESAAVLQASLREKGVRMFAATLDGSEACYRADLTRPTAIVIGAEDVGLDETWRGAAEASGGGCVRIPMRPGPVDSLNASNAAAILLYEALRQRSIASGG